jgi:hypothetical protein
MTVKDLRKYLDGYEPNDEIVTLWWDKDSYFEYNFTDEQWKTIVDKTEDYSFDGIHEIITSEIVDIATDLGYKVTR